jgi:branched-subunit amino acid transport protein
MSKHTQETIKAWLQFAAGIAIVAALLGVEYIFMPSGNLPTNNWQYFVATVDAVVLLPAALCVVMPLVVALDHHDAKKSAAGRAA